MYDFFTYLTRNPAGSPLLETKSFSHRKPSFVTKSNNIWLGVLFRALMQSYTFHPRFDAFLFYPFLEDIFSLLSACLFHALTLLHYAPLTLQKIVIFLLHEVLLFVFSRIPRKLFKWASAQASLFCLLTVSYSLAFCLVLSSDEEDHTHSHRVLSTPPAIYCCRAFISPSNPMGQGLLSWMPGKWHNSLYLNYYNFFYFQQHSSHLNYNDFFSTPQN